MGFYLNNASSLTLYKSEVESPYFVDKSRMLAELFPLTELGTSMFVLHGLAVLEKR